MRIKNHIKPSIYFTDIQDQRFPFTLNLPSTFSSLTIFSVVAFYLSLSIYVYTFMSRFGQVWISTLATGILLGLVLMMYTFIVNRHMATIKKAAIITSQQLEAVEEAFAAQSKVIASNHQLEAQQNEEIKQLKAKLAQYETERPTTKRPPEARHIPLDKGWDHFKQHFKGAYPAFFSKLKHHYPALTTNDMRYCALIKMGSNTKETAAILGVSTRAVEKARERMKKKLMINSTYEIEAAIHQL